MKHQDIQKLYALLSEKQRQAETRYIEYLESLVELKDIAEKLSRATEELMSLPQISFGDFEIDG